MFPIHFICIRLLTLNLSDVVQSKSGIKQKSQSLTTAIPSAICGDIERGIWQAEMLNRLNNSWLVCSPAEPTRATGAITGGQKKKRRESARLHPRPHYIFPAVCVSMYLKVMVGKCLQWWESFNQICPLSALWYLSNKWQSTDALLTRNPEH